MIATTGRRDVVKFWTDLPGLYRYPPLFLPWQAELSSADFQLVARTADELGFDAITVPEHIVMPVEQVDLMGAYWTHALTAMSFIAGATTRIAVNASVIVLPYHHPVILAKAIATLDVLSGGRVIVSVGVGHTEREFEVLGVPFHERGRIADDSLAAMIELWTSDDPRHHSPFIDVDGVAFEPKPVQRPYPPVWIGGNSRAAMRRAARHDGWMPWLVTLDQLSECLDYIRSQPEFEGRTRPFDVSMSVTNVPVDEHHRPVEHRLRRVSPTGTAAIVDAIGGVAEAGVTWTSIPQPPATSLEEHLDRLRWAAEEIIPAFRVASGESG
jgi:probable F420-dependent oxidoreductase